MSSLMWVLFVFMLGLPVLALLWLIWKLRSFSQSHSQTVLDDRLLQSMLGDAALSKDQKRALVRQSGQGLMRAEEEAQAGPAEAEESQPANHQG